MQKNKCQCEYIWHLYLQLYWYIPVGVSIIEENTCRWWSYIGNSALRPGWHNTYILEQRCGFDIRFNFLPIIKFVVWGCKYEDMVKRRTSVKKKTTTRVILIYASFHFYTTQTHTDLMWMLKKNKKQKTESLTLLLKPFTTWLILCFLSGAHSSALLSVDCSNVFCNIHIKIDF